MTRKTSQRRGVTQREKNLCAARFLATHPDKQVVAAIWKHAANPELVKMISNAALNVVRGPVYIKPADKILLRPKLQLLHYLASRRESISNKRKAIQTGGGPFLALLPILLSTVLSSFGSRFFADKTTSNNADQE